MTKFRNKAVQRKQSKAMEKKQQESSSLKQEMQQLMASKDYATALEVMAEIAGTGSMDVDTMYMGAKCYFLLGDYDRAARWLDNVLSRQDGYLPAKILLAAVCIAQKRYEDGLKLCEHILAKYEGQVLGEEQEMLENGLKYVAAMQKALFKDYPACRKYLGITDEAANALAKLHKLMDSVKQGDYLPQANVEEAAAEDAAELAVSDDGAVTEGTDKQADVPEEAAALDTDQIITDIMSKAVSLREKIRLFNAFAGGCYQAGDYQSAFELLSAAMQLDDHDDLLLKNIAYTCLDAGEKEQALEYVAKMNMMDFTLLHAVKNA